MHTKHWVRLGVAVGLLCIEASALGQTAADKKKADELFAEALKLGEKGDFAAACPKLEEVHALDPTDGTLFSLAKCHEQAGKLATALWYYRTYLETYGTLTADAPSNRIKRVELSKARIEALEVEVPKLKLVWRGNMPKDVEVTVDGVDALAHLNNAEWALNPGEHWVVVERGDRDAAPHVITLKNDKPVVVVDLTPSDAGETVIWMLRPSGGVTSWPVHPTRHNKPPSPAAGTRTGALMPTPGKTSNTQRLVGGTVFGVGAVGIAAGVVLGGIAVHQKGIADAKCDPPDANGFDCDPAGMIAARSTLQWGNASTAAFVAGGVVSVVGLVLVLKKPKPMGNVTMQFVAGGGNGFVSAKGAF